MDERIKFGDIDIPVYYDGNLDNPIFKFKDLKLPVKMLERIEADEWFKSLSDGDLYVTELGLYDLLSIDDSNNARLWRRVVHEQLIELRKAKEYNMTEQFEEWEELASAYYIDEETGRMMKSVTVEGGDVVQVPA